MKTSNAIIFGLAIIISAFFIANAYSSRTKTSGNISVKGLGQIDFTSDLIVWSGSFSETADNLQQAYSLLDKDRTKVLNYLKSKGVNENEIVFDAVNINTLYKDIYNDKGKYIGQEKSGYKLTQNITITSGNVDNIENISRKISELINQGINFYSHQPEYYYTKLADLKLELIQAATQDAHSRAEKIAINSGASLGKLLSAKMGVFQITGLYDNEDYSWGGVFNTSSKEKTASITVRLVYQVK
jgi:hypothetical protein